jgi:hypothetical protein
VGTSECLVWDPLCFCFKLHFFSKEWGRSSSLSLSNRFCFAGSGLDSPVSFYFSLPCLARVKFLLLLLLFHSTLLFL